MINYKDPIVAGYLLVGGIFVILGFSRGVAFLLLGAIFIVLGIRQNNKVK